MTTKLTDAQGLAIHMTRILNMETGEHFDPYDIYPSRDAEDNGHRRALRSLVEKGLCEFCDQYGQPRHWGVSLKIVGDIKAAYDEWLQRRGFRLV